MKPLGDETCASRETFVGKATAEQKSKKIFTHLGRDRMISSFILQNRKGSGILKRRRVC